MTASKRNRRLTSGDLEPTIHPAMKMETVFVRAGGQSALAEKVTAATGIEITRQAVHKWQRVPPRFVRVVAKITGISPRRLRPDLYDFRVGAAKAASNFQAATATTIVE